MKQFSKDLGNVSLAPKGKWSSEQEYERLNLVYNACDNLSYVAKIDVPIGVEIDNREYWQPMNATGYADNNFINLTTENENGTITAYESLEEAVATILPINRRAGATLSFYNLNSDRLDRQAEFELWQFNSTDLANWEIRDYWNNIYYNWNVFVGWYVGADALKNHVKIPNVGQYAYVGSNLNDAILYQCRTNGTWTNTGIKVRNYISVVVSGNITIGENGNWFSDSEDTGIPATPDVDEQLDNIIMRLQQHDAEINNLKASDANLQDQITSNDSDITNLNAIHESLSRTVQGIAATGGASTATNVTYNNDASGLNAENTQDAIDELNSSKVNKSSIMQELGDAEDKVMSQKATSTELNKKANKTDMDVELNKKFDKESIAQEFGDSKDKVVSQFALPYREIEYPEFIKAIVDAEDHFLFGIQLDGSIEWGKGIPAPIRFKLQEIINQCQKDKTDILEAINAAKEELSASITALLEGKVDKEEGKSLIENEVKECFRIIENEEFLKAIVDSDDKVLSATYNDGSHYIHNVISETIPTEFDHIEDKEGRLEITVDANGKVLADRKRDGERYETKMNIESLRVSNLNLEGNSSYDIAKALKEINYKGLDWSDWVEKNSTPLELAIPRKAIVNITGVKNLPSKKAVNDKAYLEYYDLSGNYFKVKAYLNAQGASTLADPMKSCAIDLFSNDWGGESYEVKFGNWIAQDSFHLKAFYKDALKSIQPISFDIGNQILSYLNVRANRFHIMKTDDILSGARGDTKYDFSQALCMPSQFPVEVYLNGDYYGLFMWSLKKNRDNYSMDKKDYTSILIDNVGSIYHHNGDIGCSWDELKNPKTLICVDGKKYDADTHMGEIIGTDTVAGKKYTFKKLNAATTDFDYFTVTSVDYNPLNNDMKNTAKTKAVINECSKYVKYIHDAVTDEEKKKLALKYFDVPNIIAYIIFTELTFNQDGRINNAQITIYDGKVGYNIYDCDSCLGKTWSGVFWSASIVSEVIPANKDNWMPTDVIKSLFSEEINACYKKLRDSGVISTENINKIIDSWFDRIGKETLERSIKKWSSPSYREATNVNINWEFYICKSLENEVVSQYDESVEYHVGDKVYLKNKTGWDSYNYKCIKNCTGIYPTKNNSLEPNAVYDSFSRIKEWIKYKIEFCDKLFLYNQ